MLQIVLFKSCLLAATSLSSTINIRDYVNRIGNCSREPYNIIPLCYSLHSVANQKQKLGQKQKEDSFSRVLICIHYLLLPSIPKTRNLAFFVVSTTTTTIDGHDQSLYS